MTSRLTPSQTAGPFFHDCLLRDATSVIVSGDVQGQRVRIEGTVRDGAGNVVTDAMIEVWQADPAGRYRHPADSGRDRVHGFLGWGRAATDDGGTFRFETIKPGRVPVPDGVQQAPHLVVHVFARGLLDHLTTRLYFADDPANDEDPLLASLPVDRRATLMASPSEEASYRFDVVLQGPGETVFFDVGGRRGSR